MPNELKSLRQKSQKREERKPNVEEAKTNEVSKAI